MSQPVPERYEAPAFLAEVPAFAKRLRWVALWALIPVGVLLLVHVVAIIALATDDINSGVNLGSCRPVALPAGITISDDGTVYSDSSGSGGNQVTINNDDASSDTPLVPQALVDRYLAFQGRAPACAHMRAHGIWHLMLVMPGLWLGVIAIPLAGITTSVGLLAGRRVWLRLGHHRHSRALLRYILCRRSTKYLLVEEIVLLPGDAGFQITFTELDCNPVTFLLLTETATVKRVGWVESPDSGCIILPESAATARGDWGIVYSRTCPPGVEPISEENLPYAMRLHHLSFNQAA